MAEKSLEKELQDQLVKKFNNAWEQLKPGELERVFEFGESYKHFMDMGKTERECVDEIVKNAIGQGFISLKEAIRKGNIKAGDKI